MYLFNTLLRCPVTAAVLLICIIMYIRQNNDPVFTGRFSCQFYMIQSGQYYRLLTGGFLHANLWHIFMNMYSLYNLGTWMEMWLGPVRYAVVLLGGVIVGNLFCYLMKVRSSIGLSGGLYALMFFYFVLLYRMGYTNWAAILQNNIMNIMINFMPGIAWQAHLGGAAFGILTAVLFH